MYRFLLHCVFLKDREVMIIGTIKRDFGMLSTLSFKLY